jgi:hypothetical protein
MVPWCFLPAASRWCAGATKADILPVVRLGRLVGVDAAEAHLVPSCSMTSRCPAMQGLGTPLGAPCRGAKIDKISDNAISPQGHAPPVAAAPSLGMEHFRPFSQHCSHAAWRPKPPGQIGFGPTRTGPEHRRRSPHAVAQAWSAWPLLVRRSATAIRTRCH